MSYVYFNSTGYLPTDFSNYHKRHISMNHDYGVYLNEDPGITKLHIEVFNYCSKDTLKKFMKNKVNHIIMFAVNIQMHHL